MMELGIFGRTYTRPSLEKVLDAVHADGLAWVQLNLASAGLPTVPEQLPEGLAEQVRQAVIARGLRVAGLSGTVNLIHPDDQQRAEAVRRLSGLIAAAPAMGADMVSLCTGSRDAENMWRRHPGNDTPEAWADLRAALEALLPAAEMARVALGVEPEPANVISSAPRARRLLDEVRSPALKIIFDGANLVAGHPRLEARTVLNQAAEMLAPAVISAHAKNLDETGREVATGDPAGVLDYDEYLQVLRAMDYRGPLVMHGLREAEVTTSAGWLHEKIKGH